MESPQDRYIQVGKFKTRYWVVGNQGSSVILIHGIGEYIETWSENFEALAAHHRVYALDLPGHGKTDKHLEAAYDVESLAGFVKDFMGVLGLEKAHIVGHSLGGATGTRLAVRYPALVDRLALVAPAGFGKGAGLMLRLTSVPLLGELLSRPNRASVANLAKLIYYNPACMTEAMIDRDFQIANLPGTQQAFLKTLRANGNLFGQKESMFGPNLAGMSSFKNPVLIAWGREDQIVPSAHAEVAVHGFPNARLQMFEKCGHVPMVEHAERFNELLLNFLGE